MKVINCGSSRSKLGNTTLRSAQARHLPILGEAAQERLSELSLGVVGLGGIGSELVEKLKRLFPQRLVLADDDSIESTNLNRVVGSSFNDARQRVRKTDLAYREVIQFNPDQEIKVIHGNILDEEIQRGFRSCDVIFCATDNVASRFSVSAFGLANGCAVIDVATGIIMGSQGIKAAGGQVFWLTPGSGWCPFCSEMYDPKAIASGLLDSDELKRQRAQGYVQGEDVIAPQVGALNGILAGFAVWMFMRLVSGKSLGFDGIAVDAVTFSSHTWKEGRILPNTCHYCSDEGSLMMGDLAASVIRANSISLSEITPPIIDFPLLLQGGTKPTADVAPHQYQLLSLTCLLGQHTY